jgi:hypothetical protein
MIAGQAVRHVILTQRFICRPPHPPPPQVLIPDVQKLINQLGNVSTDLFNTRLIKPPTSVLVFPLKTRATGGGLLRCAVHDPKTCCRACVLQRKSGCRGATPLLFCPHMHLWNTVLINQLACSMSTYVAARPALLLFCLDMSGHVLCQQHRAL